MANWIILTLSSNESAVIVNLDRANYIFEEDGETKVFFAEEDYLAVVEEPDEIQNSILKK